VWLKRCLNKVAMAALVIYGGARLATAQEPPVPATMQKILDRLDALENENQALLAEIKSLRAEVKAQPQEAAADTHSGDMNDRVAVAENRIAEQAQTKVGSSQRMPITLTGMILFDSSLIHGTHNPAFQQSDGDYGEGAPGGGATLRQSIIGLSFQGPHIAGGGQINGEISMDFASTVNGDDLFRIRNGEITFDWKSRSVTIGQDKTIIAPLQPTSFAHVAVPALSGAGNLWLWRPQIKYEERHQFSSSTNGVFQGALFLTDETYNNGAVAQSYIESARPALQARLSLSHDWSDRTKWSVGVGAHASESHAAGKSIASRVVSSDILFKPLPWLELSGTLLHGENFANLGGLPTGVAVNGGNIIPIKGTAGWLQIVLPVTRRLTFDAYTGRQVNVKLGLTPYQIAGTLVYAGNILYRIGPNLILGFEGGHEDVVYANRTLIFANRYDATLAFLF